MATLAKAEYEPEDADAVNEVLVAERFHWTLDYWRSLDAVDREQFLRVLNALDAARRADEDWRKGSVNKSTKGK